MVDDKDDISESGSENDDEFPEIQEISALEHFSSMLQKAHDLILVAEQKQEKRRK